MKSTYRFILIALVLSAGSTAFAQRYNDTIITKKSDTIHCTVLREYGGMIQYTLHGERFVRIIDYQLIHRIILSKWNDVYLKHMINKEGYILDSFSPQQPQQPKNIELGKKTLPADNDYNSLITMAGNTFKQFSKNYFIGVFIELSGGVLIIIASLTIAPELVIVGSVVAIVGGIIMIVSHVKIAEAGRYLEMAGRAKPAEPK